ncbi:MAG TPA: AI-2E family transporter [Actinomycetes bacterium]|nr:AI-2E family transporter [Actinomycetes bacterium]
MPDAHPDAVPVDESVGEHAGSEPDEQLRRARRSAQAMAWAFADPRWLRRVGLAVIAVVFIIKVVDWLFAGTKHLLFLVLLAWLFAIAMEPAVGWLARRGVRRGYGTGIVMVCLFLATVAFFAIFGTLLLDQIVTLVEALPDALVSCVDWINNTFHTNIDPSRITDLLEVTPTAVADWASTLGLGLFGFVTSLVGVVFDLFTVLLFAFYFSADGPRIRRIVASWLPQESQRVVNTVWEITVQKTGGYVVSRLILAIISATATSAFLFAIDIPYWLPLGIWTGVVSQFIPTIGTYLGGALPALFGFSSSVLDGVSVIVFVIVYQQVENYFLSPRISNRTMEIHPAVAFGAVIVGGALGGAYGALIAIPIVATIQAVIETYGRRYELIPELAHSNDHPLADRQEIPASDPRPEPKPDPT